MFRCVTQLKGLIIDIDSFGQLNPSDWIPLSQKYSCLFLTSSDDSFNKLTTKFHPNNIVRFERFIIFFAPNKKTHSSALKQLNLKTSEVAYVSSNHQFMSNALKFLSGTIWINSSSPTYQEVSSCPDLICDNIAELSEVLDRELTGLFGEVAVSPKKSLKKTGFILSLNYSENNFEIPLYAAGRYCGYDHYMNQLHPYSSAIYLNKQNGKKYFGSFNNTFAKIFSIIVKKLKNDNLIQSICHVPPRPGKTDRFKTITAQIANDNVIEDISENFVCIKDYPSQKNLSARDRYNNVESAFKYNGDLSGKTVVFIDDVMTTGSTIRACVEQLQKQGSKSVLVIVLAINQIDGSYWSSAQPYIHCPICDAKMHLLVNSKNQSFFYSCYERCLPNHEWKSLPFVPAWEQLIDRVNSEFSHPIIPDSETNI